MRPTENQTTRMLATLRALFAAQARDALSRTSLDRDAPDMSGWVKVMANATQPTILQLHQQGAAVSAARIAAKVGATAVEDRTAAGVRRITPGNDAIFGAKKGLSDSGQPSSWTGRIAKPPVPSLHLKRKRWLVCKAAGDVANLKMSFDLFSPKVLDAVDQATMLFCRETMETATGELDTALERLRELLRLGLPRGDAVQLLAKETRRIFADPMRAFRIATTETSRAMHGGQLLAAEESGVVTHKEWLASADACKRCLDLNGKRVKLREPFWVDPKGGVYASVWYPPLHPHSPLLLRLHRGDRRRVTGSMRTNNDRRPDTATSCHARRQVNSRFSVRLWQVQERVVRGQPPRLHTEVLPVLRYEVYALRGEGP